MVLVLCRIYHGLRARWLRGIGKSLPKSRWRGRETGHGLSPCAYFIPSFLRDPVRAALERSDSAARVWDLRTRSSMGSARAATGLLREDDEEEGADAEAFLRDRDAPPFSPSSSSSF